MKWGILAVSTADRESMLLTMLASVGRVHPGAGVMLVLQGYPITSPVIHHPSVADVVMLPEPIGPHSARVVGLPRMLKDGYRAIVNLDDDIELIDETDFRPSVLRAATRGVGVITNNWRRTPEMAAQVINKREFKTQPIVPTGGGLTYSSETAEVILAGPDLDYLFDDAEWSLRAYLSGLENQRYQGSMSVHRIRSSGGRHAWIASKRKRALSDERFIKYRASLTWHNGGPSNAFRIPISSDLTPLARSIHKERHANI